jgi:hypothetical protein
VDAERGESKILYSRFSERLLQGCSSVLKRFGVVVLVIENRFGGGLLPTSRPRSMISKALDFNGKKSF